MNQSVESKKERSIDKTEKYFRIIADLKRKKIRARIITTFDGSGNLSEFEVTEKY